METLQAIRNEIVTNLPKTERPASSQDELLDELYRTDAELETITEQEIGKYALIPLEREWYVTPPAATVDQADYSPVNTQTQRTLF